MRAPSLNQIWCFGAEHDYFLLRVEEVLEDLPKVTYMRGDLGRASSGEDEMKKGATLILRQKFALCI